jgi:hypothetical protein
MEHMTEGDLGSKTFCSSLTINGDMNGFGLLRAKVEGA